MNGFTESNVLCFVSVEMNHPTKEYLKENVIHCRQIFKANFNAKIKTIHGFRVILKLCVMDGTYFTICFVAYTYSLMNN